MKILKDKDSVYQAVRKDGPILLAVVKGNEHPSIQYDNCEDIILVEKRQINEFLPVTSTHPFSFSGKWNNFHPETEQGFDIMLEQYTEDGFVIVYEDEPAIQFMLRYRFNQIKAQCDEIEEYDEIED